MWEYVLEVCLAAAATLWVFAVNERKGTRRHGGQFVYKIRIKELTVGTNNMQITCCLLHRDMYKIVTS
jgi:hypothetical protein